MSRPPVSISRRRHGPRTQAAAQRADPALACTMKFTRGVDFDYAMDRREAPTREFAAMLRLSGLGCALLLDENRPAATMFEDLFATIARGDRGAAAFYRLD